MFVEQPVACRIEDWRDEGVQQHIRRFLGSRETDLCSFSSSSLKFAFDALGVIGGE